MRSSSVGEKQQNGEADAGGSKSADGGMSRMCQVQAVRLYHLSGGYVTLVSREKRESKVVGGSDGGQTLCPEPDTIDIPLPCDCDGAVVQRSLCLVQRQGFGRSVREEASPLWKGSTRITSTIAFCKDSRQRRKVTADVVGMFLECLGIFRLGMLV